VPGFGLVEHHGRRSGRTFRTPVNVFSQPEGYAIALTYGADSDWVRNVLAAGGCELETRGKRQHLFSPRIIHDETRRLMPAAVRAGLGLMRVSDFMVLSCQHQAGPGSRCERQALHMEEAASPPPSLRRT